jgi:hypothetical protein
MKSVRQPTNNIVSRPATHNSPNASYTPPSRDKDRHVVTVIEKVRDIAAYGLILMLPGGSFVLLLLWFYRRYLDTWFRSALTQSPSNPLGAVRIR